MFNCVLCAIRVQHIMLNFDGACCVRLLLLVFVRRSFIRLRAISNVLLPVPDPNFRLCISTPPGTSSQVSNGQQWAVRQ